MMFFGMIARSLITEESKEKKMQYCDNCFNLFIWIFIHGFFLYCAHHWMTEDRTSRLNKKLEKLHRGLISSSGSWSGIAKELRQAAKTFRNISAELSQTPNMLPKGNLKAYELHPIMYFHILKLLIQYDGNVSYICIHIIFIMVPKELFNVN